MKIVIQYVLSTVILFPIIFLVITYFVFRKRKNTPIKSLGYAADCTTVILFFSVTLSIASLWNPDFTALVFVMALFLAIIFTYIDWKTKKEIEISPLLKKIWRVFFIYLSVAYILIWFVGLFQSIKEYISVV